MSAEIGHAAHDNGFGYWAALTANTVRYYARMHRWSALLRAAWLVVGRGYYLEICQQCGRKVEVVWHADDDLYEAATHARGCGVFCVACFDRLADATTGSYVVWRPVIAHPGGGTWDEVLSS